MGKLFELQQRGPKIDTYEGREAWHNEILAAARIELKNKVLGGAKNMSEEVESTSGKRAGYVEEMGNWDPIRKKWISTYREDK